MFCPKCGTKNPDNGKFCRFCGTDLSPVTDALAGKSNKKMQGFGKVDLMQPAQMCGDDDKPVTWESALGKLFMGLAFLVVSIVLAFTQMGRTWWFWMLIPAFAMIGSGIAQYVQLKKHERKNDTLPAAETSKTFSAQRTNPELPPTQNDYISPNDVSYKTGDLVPPSVVEETTRHLEINQEGETMTLPKKQI